MGNSCGRREVEWVVRDTRSLVSEIDPARLREDGPSCPLAEGSEVLDEYVMPSLAVARALLSGASSEQAVEVLRREMGERGFSLSSRRARKLRRQLRRRDAGVLVLETDDPK